MPEYKLWNSKLTPQAFLERSAKAFGERQAVLYGSQRYTYSELLRRVNRFASALKIDGVKKGDRVGFIAPNVPAMLEAHFAVPLAGAVLVPINIRLSSREVDFIINHSEPKILFVDSQFGELVEPILKGLKSTKVVTILDTSDGKGLAGPDYDEFLQSGSEESLEWELEDEEELISINYTSGTTGQPKGVMCSHRGAYLQALGVALEMHLDNDSHYLWTLPMFHCNGWCCIYSSHPLTINKYLMFSPFIIYI